VNINIEVLGPCKKKVHVVFDAQEIEKALNDAALKMREYVALPGFRKGKAPVEMIKRSFEKDVVDAAKKALNEEVGKKLAAEHKTNVIYTLNYEELKFDPKEGYEFVAVVETEPEFELPNYKGLPVKRPIVDVTDKDVEDAINKLRQKEAKYQDVERAAAPGDIVVINYSGTVDGKSISEIAPEATRLAKGEKHWIRVQKDYFLPGFGEQFVGAKKGDRLQVSVEFPPNFVFKELALKKAVFDVEVLEVKEEVLPALDDKYAQSLGAKDLNELREGVRFDLKKDMNARVRQSMRDQVVEELMARVNFDLPENELNTETKEAVLDIVLEQQRRGLSKEDIEKYKDDIFNVGLSRAKNWVKARYVFKRIAEKEGIQVSNEELISEINLAAQLNNEEPKKYLEKIVKSGKLERFQEYLLSQKVVDFLLDFAKVEDVLPEQTGGK
ncbi:MAG: trigger factor, partial [Limisphaerales bacterium]|jgi:trigger factor